MINGVLLRDVLEADLPIFFEQQLDPAANHMAAFTPKEPADRDAFTAKWNRILADDAITKQTILFDGLVAGNIASFVAQWSGKREIAFWIGRTYWGKGVATTALADFLHNVKSRPLHASVAKDNLASLRVLQKCGFAIAGQDKGFANARGEEIEEYLLELTSAGEQDSSRVPLLAASSAQPANHGESTGVLTAHIPARATFDRVADLSHTDREAVRLLSLAVYPPETLADWPGRKIEWSTPEWCVRVSDEVNQLVSYVGVYVRDAQCDERPVQIGGVGGVKTHPAARRLGYAALGLRRAVEFFGQQPSVEFALLVCEPRLLDFYSRLGWREFNGRLQIRQHGAPSEFTFNRVMTHPVGREGPTSGTIDLCGSPW